MYKDFNNFAEDLKNGSETAAEEIFNYFFPSIYRFFVVRLLNKEVSEDLAQEVFLKVIKKIDSFDRKKGDFTAWIWQIAKNSLIDYYRSSSKKKVVPLPEQNVLDGKSQLKSASLFEINKEIYDKDMVQKITKMIDTFSEDEKNLFSMHYLSNLSYKEISIALSKPEGSLRIAVHRLNKKIKKNMDGKTYGKGKGEN